MFDLSNRLFFFNNYYTLISYAPKNSKNVTLVSPLRETHAIDQSIGEPMELEVIAFYDSTKTGIAIADQMYAFNATVRFGMVTPEFFEAEHHGRGQGPPTTVPIPPTKQKEYRLNEYLVGLRATLALNIYKQACLPEDSNSDPKA
ncbi:hypothetical protein TNCV_520591 [Trichonephila clavipes]|nr:hypothetical protein TNCV_520591 [Trichonephila clavipes]